MTISAVARPASDGAGAPAAGFTLNHDGGCLPLPTRAATEGPSGLDVDTLLHRTGHASGGSGLRND